MNAQDVIRKLFDYGHFRNPAMPTGVTAADLPKLTMQSPEVQTAITSYRDFTGLPMAAGGTLTMDLAESLLAERCGCPDYEEATDEMDATGRGSWPVGCHPQYPQNHAFTLQVDKRGMPGFLQPVFEQAFELCRLAYRDIGIAFIREDNNPRANTLVTWQRGAGWIGLAIVPRGPKCGDRIWAKFDNRYQPRDLINMWARLLAHEFGHNMGMSHSRGGIMNPSIVSGVFTPKAWRGDPSEPILRRYFGGEPIGGDTPTPDPDDDTKPFDWSGAKLA